MMKSNKLAVLAALLSLLVLASLFVVPAFAADAGSNDTTTTAAAGETTTAEPEDDDTTTTGSSTETTTTKTETTTKNETTTGADDGKPTKNQIRGWINLGVGALILIVLAVLCIKFRKKLPGWFAALKSECGKITWCPKDKLKKTTIVVVIIILAITATILVLDLAFENGILLLGDLVGKLAK